MRQASGLKIPGILFLAYPFIEIFGFILVCRWIGVLGALVLLVATTVLGSYVLRRAGFQRQQGAMLQMMLQPQSLLQAIAGFLLVLPGFFTDILGLLLLLPFIRQLFMRRVSTFKPQSGSSAANDHQAKGATIEGEYWQEKDDK